MSPRPSTRPTAPPDAPLSPAAVLTLLLAALTATVLSVWLVDRAVATFAHAALKIDGKAAWYFRVLTDIPDPLPPIAGALVIGYTMAIAFGVRPGPWGRLALRCALAVLIAVVLKDQLKVLAGRTWPETWTNGNPSFIRDGVYGFTPLQALFAPGTGRAYLAFPSGHMAIIAAACASLALSLPAIRWLLIVPPALVAVGMIGANYHWVSDLLFAALLGGGIALAIHRAERWGRGT